MLIAYLRRLLANKKKPDLSRAKVLKQQRKMGLFNRKHITLQLVEKRRFTND
ncbi:hypothetical protein JCM30760_04620 [Thiomicrorhabdus hydrogeniphila]